MFKFFNKISRFIFLFFVCFFLYIWFVFVSCFVSEVSKIEFGSTLPFTYVYFTVVVVVLRLFDFNILKFGFGMALKQS